MTTRDTIVAIASGAGSAWRTLIRVSGPDVPEIERRLLDDFDTSCGALCSGAYSSAPEGQRDVAAARACRVRLDHSRSTGHETTFPALAMRFHAPRSFTGQDVLELLVPAQPHLVQRILTCITAMPSVRLAGPGEFTARAYHHGKLTLEQAEGLAASIAAEHSAQLVAARRLMEGQTGERYRAWMDELVTLLALVEAGMDFSDQEDVRAIEPEELQRRAGAVVGQIDRAIGGRVSVRVDADAPRVVLAGAPNAGKSTLLNALLGRQRSIVSPIAGTTRDVLEEDLDLSRWSPMSGTVRVCDTAGLDREHGERAVDRPMQEARSRAIESATLVVHCDPDARFDPAELGAKPMASVLRVRTKADRPIAITGVQPDLEVIPVCAIDGWNLPELGRAMARLVFASANAHELVLPRHRDELLACASSLVRVVTDAKRGAGAEVIAEELREAVARLGELTGRVHPDEVIGRVFATFCIGK